MTCVMKVVALLVLASVIPVFGQGFEPRARVVIPFDFAIGDTTLPAGRYMIITPGMATVTLRNAQTFQTVTVGCRLADENPRAFETTARFRKDGDRVVLHQVVLSDHNYALDVIHGTDVPELLLAKR